MPEQPVFTVGGTVQASGGKYISRPADDELFQHCLAGDFCYVLTARQLGKSSLMVRTAGRLAEQDVRTVIIDLTRLGANLQAEQWYFGLVDEIADQLDLEIDYMAWWQQHAHLGPTQRLIRFLREVVLEGQAAPVVLFVDEIDTTLSLPFADDFFAAIRSCYNARGADPAFRRLAFVLLGVATPSDLIHDPNRTPFNIGQRIDLSDFTFGEALPLAEGLGLPPEQTRQVLGWVMEWTNGHPYLTQRLCRTLFEQGRSTWDERAVAKVVEETFFGERSRQDGNLLFVRDMLTKRSPDLRRVLVTYRKVRAGKKVVDEEQSLVKSHLKIAGLVKNQSGYLVLRNRIYTQLFDLRWVRQNLPTSNLKRVSVVSAFLTFLISIVVVTVNLTRPQPMSAGFNVAVAMFGEMDEGGSIRETNLSRTISDSYYETIDREVQNLPASLSYAIRGPDQIGLVRGATPEERALSAREIASRQNITILIYGVIERESQGYFLTPGFYVSDQSFAYVSEILSLERLGQRVSLGFGLSPGEQLDANQVLSARTQALIDLVIGTAYMAAGEPSEAILRFESALSRGTWQDDEGKDVAFILLGYAYLQKRNSDDLKRDLEKAKAAFEQALLINPKYSLPYLGLGEVALQSAAGSESDQNDLFHEAAQYFNLALEIEDQTDREMIAAKAAYGLGRVFLAGFVQDLPDWSKEDARQYFNQVIESYEQGHSGLAWQAASSHAYLGWLSGIDQDWDSMSHECRLSLEGLRGLSEGSPPDMSGESISLLTARSWGCVAVAEENLGNAQAAGNAYCEALREGKDATPFEQELWQQKSDSLGSRCTRSP